MLCLIEYYKKYAKNFNLQFTDYLFEFFKIANNSKTRGFIKNVVLCLLRGLLFYLIRVDVLK